MKRPLTHLLHPRFQTAPSTAMHLRTHTSQSPLMVIKTSASLHYIFKTEPPCVIMHLHKIHSNRKHTKPELNHMKTWLTIHHHEACLHAAVEHLKRFKSYHQSTHNHHGQQCHEPHHGQPQNGHENATYPLRTMLPLPSVASTVAAAPVATTAYASHLDPRQPWLPLPPLSP